jgi:hypothetical protein
MLEIAQTSKLKLSEQNQSKNFFKSMYFLRRHRVFQEIQGFVEVLCGNIWHFEAK